MSEFKVPFIIKYGVKDNYKDVTQTAIRRCINKKILYIPSGDHNRAKIFGDPVVGTLKHIHIERKESEHTYLYNQKVIMDLSMYDLPESEMSPSEKLSFLHDTLEFIGGNIRDEYPEQLFSMMFIKPDRKVLEIGSNIGRNTLVIASILDNQENLVTLECDPDSYSKLLINRGLNNYEFKSENAALSYRPLILKNWISKPSEKLEPGHIKVATITFQEIEAKYNIKFDTLVADCEGALYYIFLDYPDMLNGISMVVVENDYTDITHKITVDKVLKDKGFNRIHHMPGGWGPCRGFFYEVWQK